MQIRVIDTQYMLSILQDIDAENQLNITPCAFDIETTNIDEIKQSYCYQWQFDCLYQNKHYILMGRRLEEFTEFIAKLDSALNNRVYVYSRNFSFEFQFIRKFIKWKSVFATNNYSPIKAVTENKHIEFRDSLILSQTTLAKTGEMLNIKKKIGQLNYKLYRNSYTPLTKDELDYCIYDVVIDTEYIKSMMKQYQSIDKIPLTSTGRVRQDCRDTLPEEVKSIIREHSQMSVKEFYFLKQAFQGGCTHTNIYHIGCTIKNVSSEDITSSYPFCCCVYPFPDGQGQYQAEIPSYEWHKKKSKNYLSVIHYKLYNLTPKASDSIISVSKCIDIGKCTKNNGRVLQAEFVELVTTNIELDYILKFYKVDKDDIELINGFYYTKSYLPKEFIEIVLKYFNQKNIYKGIESKKTEYNIAKTYVNSLYGMCVTGIDKDNIYYDNDNWKVKPQQAKSYVTKYNVNKKRFLSYSWGIFITSYARARVYDKILQLKDDYIYCDTDSIKYRNFDKNHIQFEKSNREVDKLIDKVCEFYNLDSKLFDTPKGRLGYWDFEGTYNKAKFLGAKRYIYTDEHDELHCTVAGCSKQGCKEYLEQFKNPFEHFTNLMHIEGQLTRKLTHIYNDEGIEHYPLVDYQGNVQYIDIKSSVYLTECEFTMNMDEQLLKLVGAMNEKAIL